MKYKCETCHDSGWYGDLGPGKKGNHEYQPCDQCMAGISREPDKLKYEIMKKWDSWMKYYQAGGCTSWPRDAFESLIDCLLAKQEVRDERS